MLIIFLLFVATLHQSHNKKYQLWYPHSQKPSFPTDKTQYMHSYINKSV